MLLCHLLCGLVGAEAAPTSLQVVLVLHALLMVLLRRLAVIHPHTAQIAPAQQVGGEVKRMHVYHAIV